MKKPLYILILIISLTSCIGAIDKIPHITIEIKNNQKLIIDSICLIDVDTLEYKNYSNECFSKGLITNGKIDTYWYARTFKAKVFINGNHILISNSTKSKTNNDYYDLVVSDKSAVLKWTGDNKITNVFEGILLALFTIIGFKVLPSLLFFKSIKNNKYIIKFTLLNVIYCISIFCIQSIMPDKNFISGLFIMIVLILIIDSIITYITFNKSISTKRLIFGLLISNFIFFIASIQILFLFILFT